MQHTELPNPGFHLLNGDHLQEQLKHASVDPEFIVCRECLVEGNVKAGFIGEFWKTRADFIGSTYGVPKEVYYERCVAEFEKLFSLPENAEVNLWFEDDLFCQVNMWFTLWLMVHFKLKLKVFRIFPIQDHVNRWVGFSNSNTEQLERALRSRVSFNAEELKLGHDLWIAYQEDDINKLKQLSKIMSPCFRYLDEVIDAHLKRFPANGLPGQPELTIRDIINQNPGVGFEELYQSFNVREGIYGFGDLQVRNIYNRIIKM